MMSDYLPDDIMGNIFGFLNTMDIMSQCNAVSKRWYSVKAQLTTIKYDGRDRLQNLNKIMNKLIIKNMVCLELSDVDDTYLQYAGSLKQLKSINLSNCSEITDQGLVHIGSLQQLKSINLSNCFRITNKVLVVFYKNNNTCTIEKN
jgi:hypothetical protein